MKFGNYVITLDPAVIVISPALDQHYDAEANAEQRERRCVDLLEHSIGKAIQGQLKIHRIDLIRLATGFNGAAYRLTWINDHTRYRRSQTKEHCL